MGLPRFNSKINVQWSFLLLMTLFACSEVIDLNVGPQQEQLVIFGRVTDGLAGNEVWLAQTSPVDGQQAPVTGSTVTLLEDGNAIGEYLEFEEGRYRLDLQGDSARTGRNYALRVQLRDGREYLSPAQVMPALMAVDSIYFDANTVETVVNQAGVTVTQNRASVLADTRILDPEQDTFLKWHLTSAYIFEERRRICPTCPPPPCYVINDITPQQMLLFDGRTLKVPEIRRQEMLSEVIDSRFALAFYFQVIQLTMSEAAYDYFALIDQISNLQGSIFDTPSAPVPGHFSNVNDPDEEVLGFFEVVRADTTRIRIRSDDLDFFVDIPCPGLPPGATEPDACTNCRLIPNSTLVRPYYFE